MVDAMNKKINSTLNTVKSVAKKSVKVVAVSLPVLSIANTALRSWDESGGDLPVAFERFTRKFTGVSGVTGKFNSDDFMAGSGSLILAGIAGAIIAMLA